MQPREKGYSRVTGSYRSAFSKFQETEILREAQANKQIRFLLQDLDET